MKRLALALLLAAALLYALATALAPRHAAWGYVAAFAGAAMVGAIADWFAVVALFRRPLGLPIAHTAIIPASKDRIGHALAQFMATHFLATDWVLARLQSWDAAAHAGAWLAQPAHARALADRLAGAGAWASALGDDARAQAALAELARAGLRRVDVGHLAGRLLGVLTQQGRHQQLLDGLLAQIARLLGEESVQAGICEAIAREVKALKLVGLDQVAARLATRKLIVVIARTLLDMAEDPQHPLRQRFDALMADWVQRLQHDGALRQRAERLRDELLASPALAAGVAELWGQWRAWLAADVQEGDSGLRQRLAGALQALGERLQGDDAWRGWVNGQLQVAVPQWLARYRGDVVAWIEARVQAWDAQQLSAELERHIGSELQYIRINGTLVGGGVGLLIHAVTAWMQR
ncbi:MAG: DUF445 domain-containing protein [Burkholderiaceae bacterium]